MRVARFLIAACLGGPIGIADAQPLSAYSFEARDALNRPTGWTLGGTGFDVSLDSIAPLVGKYSLRSRWLGFGIPNENAYGLATAKFPVATARGRALRLRGFIRTENISNGYAGLWLRVDGGTRVLALDNMSKRGVRGTTLWTRYEIELAVDSGASSIMFGVMHPGSGTAWFDSLTLEVVGSARPRLAADADTVAIVRRIPEDSTRLLTDAELALAPDPVTASPENDAWRAWVRNNAHPVRSLAATRFDDLRVLGPLLREKRIVQLGESGHGVAEFNLAKVRLIKYLHEELGYDVIAFESSVFECDRAQRNIATLSATQLMRNCIFGVWHAAEVLPLFEYLKQTQQTAHPLVLAGFDSQVSSPAADARPRFFRDVIARLDTSYARIVGERDARVLALVRDRSDSVALAREAGATVAFYDSLATWLRARESRLASLMPDDPFAPMLARQSAVSMMAFTRQVARGPYLGTPIRDLAMANNLDFLLNERYPRKKVIVWAHNFHIEHREHVDTHTDGDTTFAPATMGVYTARRHRAELYTVGLYMYRGAAAWNSGETYTVAPMIRGSLENILHAAPWRYTFVDLSRATKAAGTSWMFQRIPTMDWGMNVTPLVPRDEYDGILFIDTAHPPTYRR